MLEDTTRIDFQKLNGQWFGIELKEGPGGKWIRMGGGQLQAGQKIEQVFSTLESEKWIVRKWKGGARAFKGCLRLIRDPERAERCRQILLQAKRIGDPETVGIDPDQLDFRYDYTDFLDHAPLDIHKEEAERLARKGTGKSSWERRLMHAQHRR
jgi:hypothetical protein